MMTNPLFWDAIFGALSFGACIGYVVLALMINSKE